MLSKTRKTKNENKVGTIAKREKGNETEDEQKKILYIYYI